jgi:hypothetical protein
MKEWLLGENYKYFDSFAKFEEILVNRHTLKVDDSITDEYLTISETDKSTSDTKVSYFPSM